MRLLTIYSAFFRKTGKLLLQNLEHLDKAKLLLNIWCFFFRKLYPSSLMCLYFLAKYQLSNPGYFLVNNCYTFTRRTTPRWILIIVHAWQLLLAFTAVQLQSHFYDERILASILLVHNLLQSSFVTDTSRVDMLNKVIRFDCSCLCLFWNMTLIKKTVKEENPLTSWQATFMRANI